ncbi:TPA: glycosyltransferase family 2 protein [Vibrio parahaemolyticus]|nr:glycosyltransferase family 2 protein [Vibrio parahaemolyticus]
MLKVKVAAIAKDEGAYISEWVHHHLYFGFDEVEVYVNNTSDRTTAILDSLCENYAVKYQIRDDLVEEAKGNFQKAAYNEIALRAKLDGFTHVLFIDIDEFWTPKDFTMTVKDFLSDTDNADCYVFQWSMHHDEKIFSPCFTNSNRFKKAPQLKHLINLSSSFENVGIHNTYGDGVVYRDSSGAEVIFDSEDKLRSIIVNNKPLSDAVFIVHRAYRSQLEYVSMLLRGRPTGQVIKNNRLGYYKNKECDQVFTIDDNKLDNYVSSLIVFNQPIMDYIAISRNFVIERFKRALEVFSSDLNDADRKDLKVALRNVTIDEVVEVHAKVFGSNKTDNYVDSLRELAFALEADAKIDLAYLVLSAAQKLRPHGPVINNKIKQYKEILARDSD